MENFLKLCKKNLENLGALKSVYIVLGNEACDLDSAVSALVTAYLFHQLVSASGISVFPVLNIRRGDLRLRTEVVYFLRKLRISLELLICKDEINIKELFENEKLSTILVDHNALSSDDAYLEMSVIEIIDHHVQKFVASEECEVTIAPVGSCCTLVAEKILQRQPDILDAQVAMLLYGTIILDTVCLKESAKRVTPRDIEVVTKLESIVQDVKKETIYDELVKAKSDISDLTFEELLRKDLKIISGSSTNLAISSIPVLIQALPKPDETENSMRDFCSKYGYQALVVMGAAINEERSEIEREIAFYSPMSTFQQEIISFLQKSEDPNLELQQLNLPLTCFRQKNSTASRKILLPLLEQFLQQSPSILPTSVLLTPASTSCNNGSLETIDDLNGFDPLNADNSDGNPSSPRYSTEAASLIDRLGVVGESLSSQSSSAQNSCPYTPQNSFVEDIYDLDESVIKKTECLPSFNSREMIEKIEHKRGKLGHYDKDADTLSIKTMPFTPKNSFVDSNFENYVSNHVLDIDADSLIERVREKKASLAGESDFPDLFGTSDDSHLQRANSGDDSFNGICFTAKGSSNDGEFDCDNDTNVPSSHNSPTVPVITTTNEELVATSTVGHASDSAVNT